jgi:type II secretory pathway pseudopilin PulG
MLLIAIALIGVAASASLSIGAAVARRDAERQLLTVGLEYQQALRSYAGIPSSTTVATAAHGPRALDELLKDPRVPGTRRHLRQLYADPLTGRVEWGLVRDAQGYIVGIHSMSDAQPIQRDSFEVPFASFGEAEHYSEWIFGLPQAAMPVGKVKVN